MTKVIFHVIALERSVSNFRQYLGVPNLFYKKKKKKNLANSEYPFVASVQYLHCLLTSLFEDVRHVWVDNLF